ncbi:MAG TPA: recombinase RecT [Candidatus Limnocylindria bacterium]|nr:recombinase RecT [Candidatus Limnocylindria bacterium]
MSTTAVARVETPHPVMLAVESNAANLEPLLPDGVTLRRVMSALWAAAQKNPDILQAEPNSVVASLAKILQWGLEVGHTAHILVFKGVATPCADYKGLAELIVYSGAARSVVTHCVYEGEPFRYRETATGPDLEHLPTTVGRPGKLLGAYCLIRETAYLSRVKYMTVEEVDRIRLKYSKQWSKGACEPWYAEKTALRQAVKLISKNPKLAKVLAIVEDEERVEATEIGAGEDVARVYDLPAEPRGFHPNPAPALTTAGQYGKEYEMGGQASMDDRASVPTSTSGSDSHRSPGDTASGSASEEQISALLELSAHESVPDNVRSMVEHQLEKGVSAATAVKWIDQLKAGIASKAPADTGNLPAF